MPTDGISWSSDRPVLARPKAVDLGASKLFPCKICTRSFARRNSFHVCCSPACGIQHARNLNAKRDEKKRKLERKVARRELRAFRVRTKTLRQLTKEAQHEFNRYIRERDYQLGCVSCDKPASWDGQWHASHYRSTGAHPELRFEEANAHKACAQCNTFLSGNLAEYRVVLLRKIGVLGVERLERSDAVVRRTREELIEIRRTYLGKWKALKAQREARA